MKIAITGSIGSGKSTVCDYIRSKGYDVFDCDKVNAELLNKGNLGYLAVRTTFPEVFDGDEINKARLANIVFKNETSKKILENILHPLILDRMNEEYNNKEVFFAEVPLLFETGWNKYFDINVLVYSDEFLTLDRLAKRGEEIEDVRNRIKNQLSNEDKALRADEIIYNNGSLNDLYEKVDRMLVKYVG